MKLAPNFLLVLASFSVVCGMTTWENEDDSSMSQLGIGGRHCSCSKHHHQCGCCLRIKAHPMHHRINADVCMNASYVPEPPSAEFMLLWNKKVMFNKTISAHLKPICFGLPHLKIDACVKFTNISLKKGHIGACAALQFKAMGFHKDIPLGCFFFRAKYDGLLAVDMETFLDTESFLSLLEDSYGMQSEKNPSMENLDSFVYLTNNDDQVPQGDDVIELVTVNKGGCQCEKSPPHCDCCVQFKLFHFPIKACVHGVADLAHTAFEVAVTINDLTIFKKRISEENPPPICKRFKILHMSVRACLKLTNVSLAPGHIGACVELEIGHQTFSLGCIYMAGLVTKE